MPAYHSGWNEAAEYRQAGNMALLPLRTRVHGPAPPLPDPNAADIIDESLDLFRANSLFRNFEIKGPADRVLIYLILFISDCLSRIAVGQTKGWTPNEAGKQLASYAVDNFALPGEPGFPLNTLYAAPTNPLDADQLRQFLRQARQECAVRLVERVYIDGKPSKWWMCFQKRKFMGKSLS